MARGKGFEGGVNDAETKIKNTARRAKDLAKSIDEASNTWSNFGGKVGSLKSELKDLTSQLDAMKEAGKDVFANTGKSFTQVAEEAAKLEEKITKTKKQLKDLYNPVELLSKGFDKLAKGFISINKAIMTLGLEFLVDGIKRVYDLQERWTQATGKFNLQLGGLSKGLQNARRAAAGWDSAMRSLTGGDIGEGMQMFADFSIALNQVVQQKDPMVKFGFELARGFNLGGEGAGNLIRSFKSINVTADDGRIAMSNMIDTARDMNVPINLVAKDIAEANDYLVKFGKSNLNTFVKGAAYARKFGMSISDVNKSMSKFNSFDEAATSVAKFNTVFGTSINSVDIFLQDDPSARLETLRSALLSQGKTFDNLTIKQRAFAAQQLEVNETQLAALLNGELSSVQYSKQLEKQAAKEKTAAKAKKDMEKQLQSTVQTLYNFGQGFDKVTAAIARAIRPLLEVLGLAKSGGKEWKSFGAVMDNVFSTVASFFDDLATNKSWTNFMKELADDLVRFGKAAKEFITSGKAVDVVGKLVDGVKDLYRWGRSAFETMVKWGEKLLPTFLKVLSYSKEIIAVWAGLKAAKAISGLTGGVVGIGGAIGGAAMGAGVGTLTGRGTSGAIGGAIGGAAGSMLGPVGSILGSAVGGFVGTRLTDVFNELFPEKVTKNQAALNVLTAKSIQLDKDKQKRQTQLDAMNENAQIQRDVIDAKKREEDRIALEKLKGNTEATDNLITKQQEYWTSIEKLRAVNEEQASLSLNKFKAQQGLDVTVNQIANKEDALQKAQAAAARAAKETYESADELANLDYKQKHFGFLGKDEAIRYKQLKEGEKDFIKQRDATIQNEQKINIELQGLYRTRKQAELDLINAEFAFSARKNIINLNQDEYKKFRETSGAILSEQQAQEIFIKNFAQTSPYAAAALESFNIERRMNTKLATGGIVRSPTRALIGEAGPEAIIPLRSFARGKGIMPRKFGGASAKQLVNYANQGSSSSSSSNTVFVAGDVYLDGNKVGRHLVRNALSGRG